MIDFESSSVQVSHKFGELNEGKFVSIRISSSSAILFDAFCHIEARICKLGFSLKEDVVICIFFPFGSTLGISLVGDVQIGLLHFYASMGVLGSPCGLCLRYDYKVVNIFSHHRSGF